MRSWLTNVKQNAREIQQVNYRTVILLSTYVLSCHSFSTNTLHKCKNARESSDERLSGSPTWP
jgi:hypothetical protein